MTAQRAFSQVDVFVSGELTGNPVAVVVDADGLTDDQMASFARWTNLSETTFVLPPTEPGADYQLRIFTPVGELPFAGHPTLGSAHAIAEAGVATPHDGRLVQQCAAGLVAVDMSSVPAFLAPPTNRTGCLDEATLARAQAVVGTTIVSHQWVDNGPGWCAVELEHADHVRALTPDLAALGDLKLGVFGWYDAAAPSRYEVRAFFPGLGGAEDPVTGSLNASIAQWLLREGRVSGTYTARQGFNVHRAGLIHITADAATGEVWVGGECHTRITGALTL